MVIDDLNSWASLNIIFIFLRDLKPNLILPSMQKYQCLVFTCTLVPLEDLPFFSMFKNV